MSKWMLAAGSAAIALAVPALAGPGNGGGGPKEERGAAKVERGGGGGGGKAQRVVERAPERQVQRQAVRIERKGGGDQARREVSRVERKAVRVEQGNGAEAAERRVERPQRDAVGAANRGEAQVLRQVERRTARLDDNRGSAIANGDFRAMANGCPPGLAKKDNGCLPPGQAKKMIGAALPAAFAAQALSGPLSQWYRDDDQYLYRNDGDFIYRVNRQGGLIDALFPSQDRDYSYYPLGMTYPSEYDSYNVPFQYRSFYPEGGDYDYRYGDGAIYQVNRSNSAIESIVALLAGDLGVGQAMPADYGVYNVPLAYRDRYYDTPDAMYRYNDGYIYQADPKTQLITAVIDALV